MAIVAKWLTHRFVDPAFGGSIPLGRPIRFADVVELADTPHSKCGAARLAGSSPAIGITAKRAIK